MTSGAALTNIELGWASNPYGFAHPSAGDGVALDASATNIEAMAADFASGNRRAITRGDRGRINQFFSTFQTTR